MNVFLCFCQSAELVIMFEMFVKGYTWRR